jgi:transposase
MSMGKRLQIQAHAAEERAAIERVARSRTAQARQVERAKVVLAALAGEGVGTIAPRFHLSPATVYLWLHRFEEHGLAGLADQPRGGRPPTYTREQIGEVIATALTAPQALGLAFASWTLDRLAAYLAEQKGIAIKRSRIGESLLAEGLRWRKQETWFGERVEPAFAEKRGSSNDSTPLPPPAASSSASTRWVRKRQRASRAASSSTSTPALPSAPSRRSTTADGAKATSSAPSDRRPARP